MMEDAKPEAVMSQPAEAIASTSAAAAAAEDDVPQDCVRPYDILCGRSKTCFNNIGNRRFRITISMNVAKYDTITNRTERGKFIVGLARTFKEDVGFRFVRISKKVGRVELSDEEIRAKIGHALRDLSKTKAEAAAAAAMPVVTEEAKKIMELTSIIKPPTVAQVVTPEPQPRRVTNDFETDSKGKLLGFPQCPDIRKPSVKDASSDSSTAETSQQQQEQHVPKAIFFSPEQQQQQDMPPALEEAQQQHEESSKIQSVVSQQSMAADNCKPASLKPAPAKEIFGDDDYCLMPLGFHDEPNTPGLLDAIELDMLSGFAGEQMTPKARAVSMPNMISTSPFDHVDDDDDQMDHDDHDASIVSAPYNDQHHHEARHHHYNHHKMSSHPDLMSMGSDDEHMISLCESVDCLSLDLDTHP
mmetsp:Transcript_22347/g.55272  ORF Transcript_22347/g.55272 Transcript_22347/m.55272 type:complete len:415 (-) Transcript_22347:453-1697(-)